jgi:CheY-like chemotaxis protein
MTARVLFLDDEPMVLEALRDVVYPQRGFYEATFVTSAAQALEMLGSIDYDVIILDLCLEDADGIELLVELRQRFPDVVRIVLTANTDQEVALRTTMTAHQLMTKPCDGKALKQVIERSLLLRSLLTNAAIRSTVGGIDSLPSIPRVYMDLTEACEAPGADVDRVARIVQRDMAICAKLLQVANSSFFGLRRAIDTVDDAVRYLGLETVRSLALSVGAFRMAGASGSIAEELQLHALEVCR